MTVNVAITAVAGKSSAMRMTTGHPTLGCGQVDSRSFRLVRREPIEQPSEAPSVKGGLEYSYLSRCGDRPLEEPIIRTRVMNK